MDLILGLIGDARDFAVSKHGSKKYGAFPYEKHLEDVVNVLIRFGYFDDTELVMAAYLHDVMEDEGVQYEEINDRFGTGVASLVTAVSGFGKNRKERHAMILKNLIGYERGIILKSADRIANMESSLLTNLSLLDMYLKEQLEVEEALRRNGDKKMWEHMRYIYDLGLFALFQQKYGYKF